MLKLGKTDFNQVFGVGSITDSTSKFNIDNSLFNIKQKEALKRAPVVPTSTPPVFQPPALAGVENRAA